MKRAVSISLGSSRRNKAVEVNLLGETVRIERIGTDGDMEKAAQLYKELDGQVDAFGVGGADLGVMVDDKWYPLYSVNQMVRFVQKTPIVDGTGLKNTLENRSASYLDEHVPGQYLQPRRAFVPLGVDRWGMSKSFLDGGYECVFWRSDVWSGHSDSGQDRKSTFARGCPGYANRRKAAFQMGVSNRR